MGKVSIGLRGWRFDEDEVFTDEGEFRPLEEIPQDPRDRLLRLQALVGSPCDACWLIHGDENIDECTVAAVVYGEPLSEVVLCSEHEADFRYWFAEAGGSRYKGSEELEDAFHEWFLDGGRAPAGYGGIEHVETDPDDVTEPPDPDPEDLEVEIPGEERERIDLRNMEVTTVEDGSEDEENEKPDEPEDAAVDEVDLDLNRDYPK
jgi:hypothetical protein